MSPVFTERSGTFTTGAEITCLRRLICLIGSDSGDVNPLRYPPG